MSVISIVVRIRSPTGGLPQPRQPPQMIATIGSSPTTQLSCPGGTSKTSPGATENSVPSSIRPSIRPLSATPTWWNRQLVVPATGRTCVDQRQPGSSVSRPTTSSPIRTVVAAPFVSARVSSGVSRFFVRGRSVSTRVSLGMPLVSRRRSSRPRPDASRGRAASGPPACALPPSASSQQVRAPAADRADEFGVVGEVGAERGEHGGDGVHSGGEGAELVSSDVADRGTRPPQVQQPGGEHGDRGVGQPVRGALTPQDG